VHDRLYRRDIQLEISILTEECLVAAYNSRVLEGHENADLVEGVFEILWRDILNIQSLEGIDLVVEFTFNLKKEQAITSDHPHGREVGRSAATIHNREVRSGSRVIMGRHTYLIDLSEVSSAQTLQYVEVLEPHKYCGASGRSTFDNQGTPADSARRRRPRRVANLPSITQGKV
jgi:hypothetical protein